LAYTNQKFLTNLICFHHTVQTEEPVSLILLMQREKILFMTDTIDVAFGGFLRFI
jgi:hypothetical protein